jgi:hypothetical protein
MMGDPLQPTTTAMTGVELFAAPHEPVRGLKVYGTLVVHRFPAGSWQQLIVGSSESADVPLSDRTVSRRHAEIVRVGTSAIAMRDLGSRNGTFCEGERRQGVFELRPGQWLACGRVHLAVCSEATEVVRARLQRFLGYGLEHARAVDDAQYAISHRRHLALVMPTSGARTLATWIHEVAGGVAAPLVQLSRQVSGDAAAEECRQARGGTFVCDAWPRNPAALRELLLERRPIARMVLVAVRGFDLERALGPELRNRTMVVHVPTLEERGALETQMAIDHATAEYGRPLGLSSLPFSSRELARTWGSPEELEFFVRRGVRIRIRGVSKAAELEGVSVSALSKWASRNLENP